jgi:hypothetical protein
MYAYLLCLLTALFNAQVSEHSSWSIAYYGRIVEAALAAAGQ